MQKFFKGQKIKTKKLEDIKNPEDFPILVEEMEAYCGKEGKIRDAFNNIILSGYTYNIFGWSWRQDWIQESSDFFCEEDFEI